MSDAQVGGAFAILKVADIERTIRWYTAAGFALSGRNDADDSRWAELHRGGLVLQFLDGATPWAGEPNLTGCFYVNVPDIDEASGSLHDPVVSEWGVEDREWGAREIVLQDPDGYFITLSQMIAEP